MTVQPSGNAPELRSVSESPERVRRQNLKKLLTVCGVLVALLLLLVWLAGGLMVGNFHDYDRTDSNANELPVKLRVRMRPTYQERKFAGLFEWHSCGAPFRPGINAYIQEDSPFEKLRIERVGIVYPNGSQRDLPAEKKMLYELKNPDKFTDPRLYTSGGRPEDLVPYFRLEEILPVDLQLDWSQHKTCRVQIEGTLFDGSGQETSFSVTADFKQSGGFEIVLKIVTEMSV